MEDILEKFLIEKLGEEIENGKREAAKVGKMNSKCRTLDNNDWGKAKRLIEERKPGTGAAVKEIRREKLYYLLNLTAEWIELSKKQASECCELLKKPQKLNPKSLLPFDELAKNLNQVVEDLEQPLPKIKGEDSQHKMKTKSIEGEEEEEKEQEQQWKIPEIYRWSSHKNPLQQAADEDEDEEEEEEVEEEEEEEEEEESSHKKKVGFHGFQDKLKVMERLLLKKEPMAIGISGVAGVGKTALAQEAYNDPTVKKEFLIRMWLCMSKQQRDVSPNEDPVKRMLRCLGFEADVIEKGRELALRQQLSRAKHLIVLDDVWAVEEKDVEENKKLVSLLTDCGKQGKVIATSRSPELDKVVGPKNVQRLLPSDPDSCWEIFCDAMATEVTPEMRGLEPRIVEKCEGLPLMAKMLGKYAINA